MIRRRLRGIVVGLLCSAFLTGTVLAEDQDDTYMYDVLKGFNSSSWVDHDWDNTSTSVRLDNCNVTQSDGGDVWVYMSLQREIPFWPDTGMGNKTFWCQNTDTNYWGDVEAADYHFWVKDFGDDGGSQYYLDADPVVIRW